MSDQQRIASLEKQVEIIRTFLLSIADYLAQENEQVKDELIENFLLRKALELKEKLDSKEEIKELVNR